jgi:pre-mRNA-processing factor 19
VFERRLIEKYINENGTDPTNGEPLRIDQLIDLKISSNIVKPRPLAATSIPSILKLLQDEWDACMLYSFTARQQLQTARQELSHALYQHDAACRVIARLSKELSAAREALATLKPHHTMATGGDIDQPTMTMSSDGGVEALAGITEDVVSKLQDKATVLTAARKARGKSAPESLAKSDSIKEYRQTAVHTGLHSSSIPGITALDLQATDTRMVLTGGADKTAVVFNHESEQVACIFKGHTKRITAVVYHPSEPVCITGSIDSAVRVWAVGETASRHVCKVHDAPVTGISLHATGDYVLSVSADAHWAFTDIRAGRTLCKVRDDKSTGGVAQPITCAQFHPDGLIFGAGCDDAMVKIWDLKEQTNVANFPGHTGAIKAIAFSENGYYLATAAADAVVKLWDLRKLKNFKTLTISDDRDAVVSGDIIEI